MNFGLISLDYLIIYYIIFSFIMCVQNIPRDPQNLFEIM